MVEGRFTATDVIDLRLFYTCLDAKNPDGSVEVRRPRTVLYYANGYTVGDKTLAGQILLAAGFTNAASDTGYASGRKLPLEVLAVTDPEMVIPAPPIRARRDQRRFWIIRLCAYFGKAGPAPQ